MRFCPRSLTTALFLATLVPPADARAQDSRTADLARDPATADRLSPDEVGEIERRIEAAMSEQGIPGLSVAVVVGGEIAWSRGFGLADVEHEVPATARTAYRSASIGKPITATAVMQLAERGALDLDAPIQRYCPAFPARRAPVTARQLLAHMGGIRHYLDATQEREVYSTRHYASVADALELFRDDSLLYEPGSRHLYSTFGYNLLGCAIEGASGRPFLAYLREGVFEPAGMSATRDDDPRAIIPARAAGYERLSTGELANARFADMSNRLPAGGFVTTVEDLARFAAAFMGGELVSPETIALMLEPQKTSDGEVVPYGLGWGLFPGEEWYGESEAFHGGGTPGVSGMLYLLPRRRFAVAMLANLQGWADRVALAAEIAKIALELGS